MATRVTLHDPKTGIVKQGLFGFSWTTLIFGGFPALFRGDIVTALLVTVLNIFTLGVAGLVWAFFYNKKFTLKLIERGYQFADDENKVSLARASLGIAAKKTVPALP
jgi:hypothetical protein